MDQMRLGGLSRTREACLGSLLGPGAWPIRMLMYSRAVRAKGALSAPTEVCFDRHHISKCKKMRFSSDGACVIKCRRSPG